MTRNKVRDQDLPDGALGEASHGGWAYVFTSRFLVRSVDAPACSPVSLGGDRPRDRHVLLPEHNHATRGIMQSASQLLSASDRYFTEAQAAVLRTLVTSLTDGRESLPNLSDGQCYVSATGAVVNTTSVHPLCRSLTRSAQQWLFRVERIPVLRSHPVDSSRPIIAARSSCAQHAASGSAEGDRDEALLV
jgi:hypothetical protein